MATYPKSELFSPQLPVRRDSVAPGMAARDSRSNSRDDSRGSFPNSISNALEQSLLTTRLLGSDERGALSGGDIGHSILPGHQELFVDGGPADALQQQFHRLRPEFVAVHELGAAWSRRLLTGIANASGRTLQQLEIRREGSGATLAIVDYVECPATNGGTLRIYTTDMSADPTVTEQTRRQVALVLLAYARLGVVMVGDMSVPAMRNAFTPLHKAMRDGLWPSRQMLLLPLTSAGALASLGTDISEETGVTVRTTPQVTRSADAWAFISGTWNRIREELRQRGGGFGGQSIELPALPGARINQPIPSPAGNQNSKEIVDTSGRVMTPLTASGADPTALGRFVDRVAALSGLLSCCVFPVPTGQEVGDVTWPDLPFFIKAGGHPGTTPTAASLTAQGRNLLRAVMAGASALGLKSRVPELIVTLDDCHLFFKPVPRRPDLVLLAMFVKADRPLLFDLALGRVEQEFQGSVQDLT